jgi:3-methylfumaryl-CoA hydratase
MEHDFKAWIGRSETVHDPLATPQAQAVQAMLDSDAPALGDGDALPLAWQWFHFLPRAPQALLDSDGHPQRGGFLPPIPYPRRMFAGARMKALAPLVIGEPAERIGTVRDVALKSGKSGALAFVTVEYRFVQRGVTCIEEEQDIVYREPGPPVPAPVAAELPPLAEGAWSCSLVPDTRLLFRFSALTFNAHRIHYDRPYAMAEEGYPGLVVHGPLTALLLLDLVRRNSTRPVAGFMFRGLAPLFDGHVLRLVGRLVDDSVELEAQGADGRIALAATATLG